MAPSREIEKLQRRWQENPLGLTFAPLAEAYRKEGMVADALELLDIGLTQHPSYVPAHIVKGRCFIDTRSDPDAERAFLRVTDLDPENVIALKGLAEIAERSGRVDDAIERLERLLEFDRSNEDAQVQLDQLRLRRSPAPERPPETAASFEGDTAEREVPPAQTPPVEGPPAPAPQPPVAELPRAEIVDEARHDIEVTVFSPVELTASEDTEFQERGHAEALASAVEADREIVLDGPMTMEAEVEAEAPVAEPPAADRAEPTPPPADGELTDEPALVVTETMAEVFLRQGHRELALAVYTQLASRDRENPRIRAAIERLEAEMGSPPSPGLPVYAAVLTGGQSVRGYFEQLLATRRPGAAPTGNELSLGSVFGEERAVAPAPAEPDPSFDEFFADGSEAAPPLPAADRPAAAETGADDLEGFTDWLRGLRR